MQEKIKDRKQYLEQIRQSFRDASAGEGSGTADASYEDAQEEENIPRGYFRLRLFVSAVLFLGFVFIWKTGWSYGDIDANAIQTKIQTNLALSDSIPQISEILSLFGQ